MTDRVEQRDQSGAGTPRSRPRWAIWRAGVVALAAVVVLIAAASARAEEEFREIETKYLFGFTIGSGIGLEGEKEITTETVAAIGKRGGRYFTSETKAEFEFTPNQYVQIELGALVAGHHIRAIEGLDDRSGVALSGGFAELRYLAVERGPSSPVSVTLSVEPAIRRLSDSSGAREKSFEFEMRLAADAELIENRLYWAMNLLYEPEWVRTPEGDSERESTLGFSTALAFRPLPALVVGAEVGYFRHYDAIAPRAFVGDAVFVGPTLYYRISRKTFMTAAWSTQVAGHSTEAPGSLNLADFSRHRAKLMFALEF